MIVILLLRTYLKETHYYDGHRFSNKPKTSFILMQVFGHRKLFLYIRALWAFNSKHKHKILFISRIDTNNHIIYIYILCSKTIIITAKI